jgi:hypothetical protein
VLLTVFLLLGARRLYLQKAVVQRQRLKVREPWADYMTAIADNLLNDLLPQLSINSRHRLLPFLRRCQRKTALTHFLKTNTTRSWCVGFRDRDLRRPWADHLEQTEF